MQSDLASVVLFSTVAVKVGFNFHSLVIRRQLEGIFNYREKALEKIFGKGDVHSLLKFNFGKLNQGAGVSDLSPHPHPRVQAGVKTGYYLFLVHRSFH